MYFDRWYSAMLLMKQQYHNRDLNDVHVVILIHLGKIEAWQCRSAFTECMGATAAMDTLLGKLPWHDTGVSP